jgi:ATP-dependent protease ClpP protease subunit
MKKILITLLFLFPALAFGDAPLIHLTKSNTLVLNEVVTQESVAKIMVQARKLDQQLFAGDEPMYLILNTPGGDVEAGIALARFLNGLHRPTETVTIFAASMGFQLAQQLKTRHIVKNGTLMSHHARGGVEGEFGGQEPNQMGNRLAYYTKQIKELDEQTVKRTNGKQTLASYTHAYDHELWLNDESSVSQGYADDVVNVVCDRSIQGTETHTAEFMGMPVQFEVDKCPLNTGILAVKMQVPTNKGLLTYQEFVNKGGRFSADCLVSSASNPTAVCSLDTTLTPDKVEAARLSFILSKSPVHTSSKH